MPGKIQVQTKQQARQIVQNSKDAGQATRRQSTFVRKSLGLQQTLKEESWLKQLCMGPVIIPIKLSKPTQSRTLVRKHVQLPQQECAKGPHMRKREKETTPH